MEQQSLWGWICSSLKAQPLWPMAGSHSRFVDDHTRVLRCPVYSEHCSRDICYPTAKQPFFPTLLLKRCLNSFLLDSITCGPQTVLILPYPFFYMYQVACKLSALLLPFFSSRIGWLVSQACLTLYTGKVLPMHYFNINYRKISHCNQSGFYSFRVLGHFQ